MAERSIRAIIRAEVGQFISAMGQAATAAESVGAAAQKSSETASKAQQQQQSQARSFSQDLVKSARENQQAWSTVGTTIGAAGAAITTMTGLVANAGIQYNSLRQTATAALTSVTGSAEAAADQMARMDEFGSTSWLMRDSIIRAQQQMTGFGIETSKVIGYMDALAEAVAASGGSSQTFEELAFVMAKVESQGKITATELNEFGQRGVDAAALIGDAMGMTADQIRTSITAGTLDASEALDALAQGMMNRYEGASDLVRNTFSGAVADVQAAIRDLGAIAFGNLVDPEGGGLFVDLLNQISGFLFALRDVPPEILQVGGAIAGLGGLAATAAGGLALAIPRYVAFTDSLAVLAETAPRTASALGGFAGIVGRGALWGTALTAAAVGIGAISKALHNSAVAVGAEDFAAEIERITEAGRSLESLYLPAVFEEMPTWAGMATTSVRSLGDALDKLADMDWADHLSQAAGAIGLPSYMNDVTTMVAEVDEALSAMVADGKGEQVQAILEGTGRSAEFLAEHMPQVTAALAESGDAVGEAAPAWDGLTSSMESLVELSAGVVDGLMDTGEVLKAAFSQDTPATLQDIAEGYRAQADALREYNTNLAETYRIIESPDIEEYQLGMDWLADLMATGDDQHIAMTLDLFVNGSDEDRALLLEEFADREAQALVNVEVQDEALRQYEDYVEGLKSVVEVTADPGPARGTVNGFLVEIDVARGVLEIDGDQTSGMQTLNSFLEAIGASTEDVTINGDPVNGQQVLQLFINEIRGSEEAVTIGGDNKEGRDALVALINLIGESSGNVKVRANTEEAEANIRDMISRWSGRSITLYQRLVTTGAGQAPRGHPAGPSYMAGGYTGDGPTDAWAGSVHGQEFVIDAANTREWRPLLEAIHTDQITPADLAGGMALRAAFDAPTPAAVPVPATIPPMVTAFSSPAPAATPVSEDAIGRAVGRHLHGMKIHMTGADVLTDTVSGTILTAIGAS